MTQEWKYPGSKWWKFDFHTHTPKSDDYGRGDESCKNVKPDEWLRRAMEAGLDCVVVSDHNSGGWIDVLKDKNEELRNYVPKPGWYKELTIFPGVEITIADSRRRVHLLAVFDPSCDSQKVTGVLDSCGITSGHGDDLTTATTTSFIETVQNITNAGGVAIPAHIDGAKGLLEGVDTLGSELEKSLEAVFGAEFCDLNKFENAEPALRKALARLAKVAGSDAHNVDEIGKYFTWLKMCRPSIEGLRLALQDHKFCLKNQLENPNQLPDIFLSRLSIKAMRHCGRVSDQAFAMPLHPHFNTIIGGRGSGKSTMIEAMRIVLRRQFEVEPFEKINKEFKRFLRDQSGPKKERGVMLHDTEILLELHRRGKNYQLRWRFDGQGVALAEENNGVWQKIETDGFRERFPVSIFSQKQINELASNPRGLLAVLDRSFEVNRAEWQSRWENAKSQYLQLREQQRELLRQLAGEQQIRIKLSDIENDLRQYEEKGHGEILKQYQKRSQQRNALPDEQIFTELAADIRELASSTGMSDFPEHLFDEQDETTAEVKTIHEQAAQGLKAVSEMLDKLADNVDALKKQREEKIFASKWYQALQGSIAAYNGLVGEYEKKESRLSISLYGEWVQQRNQLQLQLKRLDSIHKEAELVSKQAKDIYAKLQSLRLELLEKRRSFLGKVIGDSPFVRMELVQYGDVDTLEEEYRELLNLNDGIFASSVYDREGEQGLLWGLSNWEDANTPESELAEMIREIKLKTFNIARGKDSGNHGAFDNRLIKLWETQAAIFDQLAVWWPEDLLRVKYSKEPSSNKFDNLEKGSAGQKAAAILAFLLSYGEEPLIIDQPEDDLDNALIYGLIVKQIHKNKDRRQLIIVTHNPNIVVNGDSELVHVLKYAGGQVQIEQQGGIEEASVRELICTIMEGGAEAFDKRYARIRKQKD